MMCDMERTEKTTQEITKLILNNTIVKFRKDVQKARIHTINKLSREIRKLRSMTGTEEQKIKNSNKADRFVQQIMFIKKVKKDDVTKFALRNEKSLIEITNDVNETWETKALARFATHKGLTEKIKIFRNAYPRWKDSLDSLLSTLGKTHQDKKAKKANTSRGFTKLNKTSEENRNNVNKKIEKPQQNLNVSFTDNSEKRFATGTKNQSRRKFKYDKSKVKINNDENTDVIDDQFCQECSHDQNSQFKEMNSSIDKEVASGNVNEIKITNEPSETKIGVKDEELANKEKNISATMKVAADPFFMTIDNKSYMSISIKNVKSDTDDFQDTNFYEKQRNFSFKNNTNTDRKLNLDFSRNRRRPTNYENNKFESTPTFKNFKSKEESSAPLHPSWEAKKRQSLGIQNCQFQGKKIKFDL